MYKVNLKKQFHLVLLIAFFSGCSEIDEAEVVQGSCDEQKLIDCNQDI